MSNPTVAPQENQEWFQAWFNHPLYMQVYSHRNQLEATECIKTIVQQIALNAATTTVLDIACGAGRHALEFARRGFRVTGNDLSTTLLAEAAKSAEQENLAVTLTNFDMRYVPTHQRYELVVQLFTSFGYFDTKDDDTTVLKTVWQLLQEEGWYVLDLLNPSYLTHHFVAESQREVGALMVHEKRTLEAHRVCKELYIIPPKGEALHFREAVWLYTPNEITALLQKVGFSVINIIGNYNGSPFNDKAPRMMLFCRKNSTIE